MWEGLDNLPESLIRKTNDDVFVCIYCGNKDLKRCNTPLDSILSSNPSKMRAEVTCGKCHRELPYLNERWYGLKSRELMKNYGYSKTNPCPFWTGKLPFWAISNAKKTD